MEEGGHESKNSSGFKQPPMKWGCCCCAVAQPCLTLCDPVDCNTPGFPVLHRLLELAQIYFHWVGDAIERSHPLLAPSPAFNLSQHQVSSPVSQLFTSGSQSIEVSASASVLPKNIQDWLPLGWTGWISLQSKGLSRVFSNTTVQKHQFFGASLLCGPTLTLKYDYWKNHRFNYMDLC